VTVTDRHITWDPTTNAYAANVSYRQYGYGNTVGNTYAQAQQNVDPAHMAQVGDVIYVDLWEARRGGSIEPRSTPRPQPPAPVATPEPVLPDPAEYPKRRFNFV
jgi:hypothetical protein